MAFPQRLPAVRQRDVERDDEVAIAWRVERTARHVSSLHQTGQGHGRELPLGVRLVDAGPERGALSGVLADRERVEELQPSGLGEDARQARRAFIRVVVRALEQRRVAVEEVEVPIDHACYPG